MVQTCCCRRFCGSAALQPEVRLGIGRSTAWRMGRNLWTLEASCRTFFISQGPVPIDSLLNKDGRRERLMFRTLRVWPSDINQGGLTRRRRYAIAKVLYIPMEFPNSDLKSRSTSVQSGIT